MPSFSITRRASDFRSVVRRLVFLDIAWPHQALCGRIPP